MNSSEPGMTFNPWPSSDWIAFITERGFAAAIVLALVFIRLAMSALRQLHRAADADQGLIGAGLLATVAGACIAGAFDAVLLLALPTIIIWTALGALWTPDVLADPVSAAAPPPRSIARSIAVAVIVLSGIGAARSVAQIMSMDIFATESSRAALERAAQIDPGSYRVHLRLARGGRQRCEHALAAVALFPSSQAAKQASRGCRER